MAVDIAERLFYPRYSMDTVGIILGKNSDPFDPDSNLVRATMTLAGTATAVFTNRVATRSDAGDYSIDFLTTDTDDPGYYDIAWTFAVSAVSQSKTTFVEIGEVSALYEALSVDYRIVIENVWARFADAFDSFPGGPYLQQHFQTHFNRGRLAILLRTALGKLNAIAQPWLSYTLDGSKPFPFASWGGVLEEGLYIETIKHLRRSYVEQPIDNAPGVTLDRRDYLDRWGQILGDEESDFKEMRESYKMSHLGLGSVSVTVAGGAYGIWGISRLPSPAAARGYRFVFGML